MSGKLGSEVAVHGSLEQSRPVSGDVARALFSDESKFRAFIRYTEEKVRQFFA